MPTFEEFVQGELSGWLSGTVVKRTNGRSKADQEFTIVITKSIWFIGYLVKLYLDEDHRESGLSHSWNFVPASWEIISEYWFLSRAETRMQEIKRQLERGEFGAFYSSLSPADAHQRIYLVPKDCVQNPDKYLKEGDLLQTNFMLRTNHEGIYVGNGQVLSPELSPTSLQVVHVSGHHGGKSASVARIGKLYGDFCDDGDSVRIKVFRARFRTPDAIARTAKEYAAGQFRHGEYHILLKNCQHFATLCAIGSEQCGDKKTLLAILKNLGVYDDVIGDATYTLASHSLVKKDLERLRRILSNIISFPNEPKYRLINVTPQQFEADLWVEVVLTTFGSSKEEETAKWGLRSEFSSEKLQKFLHYVELSLSETSLQIILNASFFKVDGGENEEFGAMRLPASFFKAEPNLPNGFQLQKDLSSTLSISRIHDHREKSHLSLHGITFPYTLVRIRFNGHIWQATFSAKATVRIILDQFNKDTDQNLHTLIYQGRSLGADSILEKMRGMVPAVVVDGRNT